MREDSNKTDQKLQYVKKLKIVSNTQESSYEKQRYKTEVFELFSQM